MRGHELRSELQVDRSIEQTFAFFENPHNLARITPPWLGLTIRSGERLVMRAGLEIDYTIRWLGLPVAWKTVIREYEPPFRFVDEQAKGPYRYWRHTHTFEERPGGTLVLDHVAYELPFGWLGKLAHRLVVHKQLRGIFLYRRQALQEIFRGASDARR